MFIRGLRRVAATLLPLLLTAASVAHAAWPQPCSAPPSLSATEQDRLLRLAALIKTELEASGARLALVARSGLDLGRFGVRYSHAGVSLKASRNTPWSVRQLYYACDEQQPKLFDEGLAGFLLGTDDPRLGYVSLLLLPEREAAALERTALDDRRALQLLAPRYSANAYPFSVQYQNCNQWLAELWALAFGELGPAEETAALRAQAQLWLQRQGYAPQPLEVGAWMVLAPWIPWLHRDDHPPEDLERRTIRTSLPASVEAFVQATVPGAQRIEFCHAGAQVVVRRGWQPIADGCRPAEGDRVLALD
ncbi:DUF2145 domain-containing protein [Aquincola sp. S2]|uniref:DUF2145 domain-containing protein n=1 Tax=Pseudaquabacterium terrae TaxID=2732868 RepID=A0ABX2EE83_9BURK|nr:DUF2145 domain-containing protein [Aquabacterium terrae]NRF66919.1 DUF2145 domain-containing protein [Aquabacterium terrae]